MKIELDEIKLAILSEALREMPIMRDAQDADEVVRAYELLEKLDNLQNE